MFKKFLKSIVVRILTLEARAVLRHYRPHIVAVTGSVGKTSTKDAIASALAPFSSVRKSEKSFNSELGVPLTILGLPNGWNNPFLWLKNIFKGTLLVFSSTQHPASRYPEWLVLEIGADRPSDIKNIAEWLHPDVVVVTRLPETPVHIEFFSSRAALVSEKEHLVHALKDDGVAILNADDNDALSFRAAVRSGNVISYGMNAGANFRASHYEILYEEIDGVSCPIGISFRLDYDGKSIPLRVQGALGQHLVYPFLAACATVHALGHNVVSAIEALRLHTSPPGRMRILSGAEQSVILDDTYNSSPAALASALLALKDLKSSGKKIAVLGDMAELGAYSREEHLKAGAIAADSCDMLLVVGREARLIAEGALNAGMDEAAIFEYEDAIAAGAELLGMLHAGDTVLVKGSQSIRMERAVKTILANPSRAPELLVRQDSEWQKR